MSATTLGLAAFLTLGTLALLWSLGSAHRSSARRAGLQEQGTLLLEKLQERVGDLMKSVESGNYAAAQEAANEVLSTSRAFLEVVREAGYSRDYPEFAEYQALIKQLAPMRDELEELADLRGLIEAEFRKRGLPATVNESLALHVPDGVSVEAILTGVEAIDKDLSKRFRYFPISLQSWVEELRQMATATASEPATPAKEKQIHASGAPNQPKESLRSPAPAKTTGVRSDAQNSSLSARARTDLGIRCADPQCHSSSGQFCKRCGIYHLDHGNLGNRNCT